MTVLILGGTAEARALAQVLVGGGQRVISSLAGRVADPAVPVGDVRVGGFGGVDGLRRYLDEHRIAAVVDATHPFAAQMSRHAVAATSDVGCAVLRLARPGWVGHPRAETWTWVADLGSVVSSVDPQRPFLTTGRQSLKAYLPWSDRQALVRVVDPPTFPLPDRWTLIRSRGPYAYAAERKIMLDHAVDALVTKDSGGSHTSAKLDAAGDLGIPVVIIARPPVPTGIPIVTTVAEAEAWCRSAEVD